MEVTKERLNGKGCETALDVRSPISKSEKSDKQESKTKEVPSIRLSPEQIEEIHADEYSLMIFYATRVEPLTVAEIKKQFPEPEAKKAQSVLDRYVKVGLVHITPEGKYYSNFPENYINYSDYRYDSDLEAKKDGKVFSLMKEFTGNKEYWKNKSYFSMDAFYTEEQTKELQEMLLQVKLKAKDYANENAKKKSIRGLFFRRLKFYDMMFSFLAGLFLLIGFADPAKAGGNDPTMMAKVAYYQNWIDHARMLRSGGGNDPTGQIMAMLHSNSRAAIGGGNEPFHALAFSDSSATDGGVDTVYSYRLMNATYEEEVGTDDGGGGHDPTCGPRTLGGGGHDPGGRDSDKAVCCVISKDGKQIAVYSMPLCRAQALLLELISCEQSEGDNCAVIEDELIQILSQPRNPVK